MREGENETACATKPAFLQVGNNRAPPHFAPTRHYNIACMQFKGRKSLLVCGPTAILSTGTKRSFLMDAGLMTGIPPFW